MTTITNGPLASRIATQRLQCLPDYALDRKAVAFVVLSHNFDGDGGPGAPGRIILQRRDGMWIVHWQNRQTGGCCDGGYHETLSAALSDMARRVEREERFAKVRAEALAQEAVEQRNALRAQGIL